MLINSIINTNLIKFAHSSSECFILNIIFNINKNEKGALSLTIECKALIELARPKDSHRG